MTDLEKQLIEHEGLRLMPYRCSEDYLTIGVGRNLDTVGITEDEALYLLRNDIQRAKQALERYDFFEGLSDTRQNALIDFMFNVGATTFSKFKNMIAALENKDYEQASSELLDSRYARQVGRRAQKIAEMIRLG